MDGEDDLHPSRTGYFLDSSDFGGTPHMWAFDTLVLENRVSKKRKGSRKLLQRNVFWRNEDTDGGRGSPEVRRRGYNIEETWGYVDKRDAEHVEQGPRHTLLEQIEHEKYLLFG